MSDTEKPDTEKPDTEKPDTKKDIMKNRKKIKQNTEDNNVKKITHNVKVWEKFIVNNTS